VVIDNTIQLLSATADNSDRVLDAVGVFEKFLDECRRVESGFFWRFVSGLYELFLLWF